MTTGWWTNWIGFVGQFGSRPARLPRGHVYVVVRRNDREFTDCRSWREVERATADDGDNTFVVVAPADYHARAEAWAT